MIFCEYVTIRLFFMSSEININDYQRSGIKGKLERIKFTENIHERVCFSKHPRKSLLTAFSRVCALCAGKGAKKKQCVTNGEKNPHACKCD